MKYLIILLIGVAVGIYIDRYPLARTASTGSDAKATAQADRDDMSQKMVQWRLTPDAIRQDLARTGEVVRSQAHVVGDKITDVRIVTVVKAKYILDRDLSACDIHVSVNNGQVVLVGSVGSLDLVGRAVALALDTDGVAGVKSRLVVSRP